MLRSAAQAVQLRRRGVQGQRFLPHRQPRVDEESKQRVGDVELVFGHRRVEQQREVRRIGKVEWLRRQIVGFGELEGLAVRGGRRQLAGYPQATARRPRIPPSATYRCGVGDSLKSLNPSLATRISQWLRPDWSRTLLARRVAAAGLVVLAGVAALRPDPDGERASVVVAAHDLGPGAALSTDDLLLEKRLVPTIPDGAQSDIDTVVGSTLAGPARRGEVLTDVRLLGRRLAEAAAGPDARIVPVHPVDSALADLVRPGDVVDVVAAADADSHANPRVVATGAIVVLVSAKQKAQAASNDRVVLVALPAASAIAVAGAALVQTVTLTLH